jgi:ClpP class serine protease
LIRFGARKAETNSVEHLTDAARAAMQTSINEVGMLFASGVATNRKMSLEAVLGTEAAVFTASQAKSIGLIDEVASFDQTLSSFSNSLEQSGQLQQEAVMASEQDIASARLEGAAAERARIGDILAIGHPGANHIAFNTNMGVAEASALLAAIPASVAPAAPAAPAPAAGNAAALAALADHQTVAQDTPRGVTVDTVKPEAIMTNGNFSIAKAVAVMAQAKGAAK